MPDQRFEERVRAALGGAADVEPFPAGSVSRTVRRARRRLARNGSIAAVAIVLLAVASAGAVRSLATPRPADRPPPVVPSPDVGPTPSGLTIPDVLVVDPISHSTDPLVVLPERQWNAERSPDSSRTVYQGKSGGSPAQIYVIGPDGTEHALTDLPGGAEEPTWSPDGSRIAFSAPFRGPSDIYVMDADGSGIRRVAGTPTDDAAPDWAPDGKSITFQSGEWTGAGGASRIWVASLAGGDPTQLPADGDGDAFPAWSPDGRWIAVLRYQDAPTGNLEWDDSDLFLMRPDGTDQHRLVAEEGPLGLPLDSADPWFDASDEWGTNSPDGHFQSGATWSPDGTRIAFSGGDCGCIQVVDVTSGRIVDSIFTESSDNPSWDAGGIVVDLT